MTSSRKNTNIMLRLPKINTLGLLMVIFYIWVSLLVCCSDAAVTYDRKAIMINGRRRILLSGSIHYPRSTPEMWSDLIQKAKDGGLDCIQTYVFWNGHEPTPGVYNFEGRYDLVKFIKLAHQAGLYVILRIGPYVCAEWNFGGFPVWLKYIPGMEFRTDNAPFKVKMQEFTEKIVGMMKQENLFEPQGGPIILSQIENEYGPIEWEIGAPGKAYTAWAASMAVGLNTEVPWIMCKQETVPDTIINTCNEFYCEGFKPVKPDKPKMWTENWCGWYTKFGGAIPYRPAEDVAFSVARFIQNGGSYVNYYMYHGGTNFGKTAGRFVTTSYDFDAPLDEYGLLREPKYTHLSDLHKAIKMCEPALTAADPIVTNLGSQQEAHVFSSESGPCAAFLANYDPKWPVKVKYGGSEYDLPPWSISILPDCKKEVYNTARVTAPRFFHQMTPVAAFSWQSYSDGAPKGDEEDTISGTGLYEQINVTRDASDYLWYTTEVEIAPGEGFLKSGYDPVLTVNSAGHALDVYVNGKFAGNVYGSLERPQISFSNKVKLTAGVNKISLLSVSVGLANVGTHFETWAEGVLGPVTLKGLNEGTRDLGIQKWSYKIGMNGESKGLYFLIGSGTVEWTSEKMIAVNQPLTWYKATFNSPEGTDPLALDMNTMGKGIVWVNGESIGRHWPANKATGQCEQCNYAGTFNETKCLSSCGEASQRWYHLPRSLLKPTGNLLVVFEEWGGDPKGISLVKRT